MYFLFAETLRNGMLYMLLCALTMRMNSSEANNAGGYGRRVEEAIRDDINRC